MKLTLKATLPDPHKVSWLETVQDIMWELHTRMGVDGYGVKKSYMGVTRRGVFFKAEVTE